MELMRKRDRVGVVLTVLLALGGCSMVADGWNAVESGWDSVFEGDSETDESAPATAAASDDAAQRDANSASARAEASGPAERQGLLAPADRPAYTEGRRRRPAAANALVNEPPPAPRQAETEQRPVQTAAETTRLRTGGPATVSAGVPPVADKRDTPRTSAPQALEQNSVVVESPPVSASGSVGPAAPALLLPEAGGDATADPPQDGRVAQANAQDAPTLRPLTRAQPLTGVQDTPGGLLITPAAEEPTVVDEALEDLGTTVIGGDGSVAVEPFVPDVGEAPVMSGGVTTLVATIQFPHGSAALSAHDRKVLREVAKLHREHGGTVRVIGHASSRTANMTMERHKMVNFVTSARRADVVAKALERYGVSEDAIEVSAVSDNDPIYYEVMPSGEAGNRRTEIYFVY